MSTISFKINKKVFSVEPKNYAVDITLNTFIRNYATWTGTKFMCLEGGCGACVVTIRRKHSVTNEYQSMASNSCLTLLNMCNGWEIITVEGIGDKLKGYHPIQTRLAEEGGSQCGYCSPGMVMNMYSLVEAKSGNLTATEIENSFGGNLCRCTGYRPILDAMKSFAKDSDFDYVDLCTDIEDLGKQCPRMGRVYPQVRSSIKQKVIFDDGDLWYYPTNLAQLFNALEEIGDRKYILVGGNTAHGVYRRDESIRTFIDTNNVPELHTTLVQDQLEIGGNVSLTEAMDFFNEVSSQPGFEYCAKLALHIDKVAHVPVRNLGTIAGNLMLKHEHNEFPSDIFLLLATVSALVHVATNPDEVTILNLLDFLNYDMNKSVILKVILPAIDMNGTYFDTYKITPRVQNAHAYVNAAFLLKTVNGEITQSTLCFGGINPQFIFASATSEYLLRKQWITNFVTEEAILILSSEANPDWVLPDAPPEYRKLLACGLFYKFILKNAPQDIISTSYISGGTLINRSLSSGTQSYLTNEKNWPLTKPIPKSDAFLQTSGEALYMNDLLPLPGQLWGAYVEAQQTKATITGIDPSEALSIKGVVAFYSAKDIPGINSFTVIGMLLNLELEEVFCSAVVKYHSQPVGIIVAETLEIAKFAANKVKITYVNLGKKVICTLQDYFEQKQLSNVMVSANSENSIEAAQVIKGQFNVGSQYHFTLEPQTTVCVPDEDELNVYCATHYVDLIHVATSSALNIPQHKINFKVRRVGGSYGGKLTRAGQVAIACALAATKLNRPVRFVQSIESNMNTTGKRIACSSNYNVSFTNKGAVISANINFIEDMGCTTNDNPLIFAIPAFPNCYADRIWIPVGVPILTDAPSNTWCRGPGSLEAIAMIENVMEHIAREVNRDPVDVRLDNIPRDSKMKTLLTEFITSTSYKTRRSEIESFNNENRWRKKGISISLMRYPIAYIGSFPATVAVYHHDGTVVVSHGGIEIGQGLNVKVAQVAAYTLGIPLEMVKVKPTTSINGANSFLTAASFGTESVCAAVKGACEIILDRLKVVRRKFNNPIWTVIVEAAHLLNISLIASYVYKMGDLKNYDVWGLACTEVEVDILTGNVQLNRVDIVEDTGESLNPLIDCGQVEGAFIMGVGLWLSEHLVYDRQTGELKTNRTWNYKVPGAKDIPVDFRITLDQKEPNKKGFLGSKATGEPAICLAVSTLFAIRHALDSARNDMNLKGWYTIDVPASPDNIVLTAGHNVSNYKL